MDSGIFPPGFPSELSAEAFVHLSETAWQPSLAVKAVEWLGEQGYAVLGTEVFRPEKDRIQSLPYFQSVDPRENENWNSFVSRAATETVTYLNAVKTRFAEEGDVYINVTWVSEIEFNNLRAT